LSIFGCVLFDFDLTARKSAVSFSTTDSSRSVWRL